MEQAHDTDTDSHHIAPGNLTQYESLFEATQQRDQDGNVLQAYPNDYAGCGWPRAIFQQFLEATPGRQIHVYGDDDDANKGQLWVKGALDETEQAVFANNLFQWELLEKLSHENAFTLYRDNAQFLMDRAMRWFKDTNLTENSLFATEQESDDPSSHDVFLKAAADEPIIYGFHTVTGKQAYKITVKDAALQLELRKLVISIKLATLPIVNEMLSEMLYRVMVRGALLDYSSSEEASKSTHSTQKAPVTTKVAPYEKHTALKTSQLNYYRMLFTCKNDANQASLDLLTTAGDLPNILRQFDIHADFAYFDFAYLKIAAFWLCFARHYTAQRKKLLYKMQGQDGRTWADEVEKNDTQDGHDKQGVEQQTKAAAAAEQQRKAGIEEQKRKAEEQKKKAAEQKQEKKAAEEEQKRKAAEEEQKRKATEEELKRKAAEEQKRKAAEAEQKRQAEEVQKQREMQTIAKAKAEKITEADMPHKLTEILAKYQNFNDGDTAFEFLELLDRLIILSHNRADFDIMQVSKEMLNRFRSQFNNMKLDFVHAKYRHENQYSRKEIDEKSMESLVLNATQKLMVHTIDQNLLMKSQILFPPLQFYDDLHNEYTRSLQETEKINAIVINMTQETLTNHAMDTDTMHQLEGAMAHCLQTASKIRSFVSFRRSKLSSMSSLSIAYDNSAIKKYLHGELEKINYLANNIINVNWQELNDLLQGMHAAAEEQQRQAAVEEQQKKAAAEQ